MLGDKIKEFIETNHPCEVRESECTCLWCNRTRQVEHELEQLKEDALLGKALINSVKQNVTWWINSETCIWDIDVDGLKNWYKQQLEKEV